MKFNNLEKLLPFGYLILVVLGIVKESVFYYQLDVNILKYSNLMDILISPISDLTSNPFILIVLIGFIILFYSLFAYAAKNTQKEWVLKILNRKKNDPQLTINEIENMISSKFLTSITVCIMFFFLGIGIGNGMKISEQIAKNELHYNYNLTFNSGELKNIYLIGTNSVNYFYVEKGNKNVRISPVNAIKTLEIIKHNL